MFLVSCGETFKPIVFWKTFGAPNVSCTGIFLGFFRRFIVRTLALAFFIFAGFRTSSHRNHVTHNGRQRLFNMFAPRLFVFLSSYFIVQIQLEMLRRAFQVATRQRGSYLLRSCSESSRGDSANHIFTMRVPSICESVLFLLTLLSSPLLASPPLLLFSPPICSRLLSSALISSALFYSALF